jgi:acetyl-CoA synthetase
VDDDAVMTHVDEAVPASPSLRYRAYVRSVHRDAASDPAQGRPVTCEGRRLEWQDFNLAVAAASPHFSRPTGQDATQNADIMLLYFTSGTTGMPKMVRHDFTYPLGHIVTAKYWQCVKMGGLHLTVADTGWAKAAWGKIYGQWLCECAVFVYDYDRFVPSAMLEVIGRHRVTSFCAPPTVYRFFIKEDLSKYDFSALEHCSVAGEPLNPEVYEQFKEATGLRLMEGYGQTELTVVAGTFPWMQPKPGSMGRAAPGYDLDLVREDGTSCEVGEEGQIVIRTGRRRPVGMFAGYYRDPELTARVWHDDVYYTGDMAWKDEDGYLWFVGRADDVIKSSGYRIGPFEVESALLEHPAVLECAVTGVHDPDRGMAVKATIVLAKSWTASDELKGELQEHVKKTTAPYKYPRVIEFVTELPKTISGKIRRVQIREQDKTT